MITMYSNHKTLIEKFCCVLVSLVFLSKNQYLCNILFSFNKQVYFLYPVLVFQIVFLYALDEENGLVLVTLCHTFGTVMFANKSIMIWFSQLVITSDREDPNTLHGSKKWEWILNTAWLPTTLSAKLISL